MSAWSESLGLSTPIVCAPMGGVAGGQLATAVSGAGALGMVGMGSSGSADRLATQLALVPAGTPIGIGLVDWVMRRDPEMLDLAIEAHPVLLSISFGNAYEWAAPAGEAGIVTTTQAASVDEARRAVDAGVDVVVARGLEGGGHGRPLHSRDRLLDEVIDAVDVPVLAAGALATRADIRGVLDRGAAAAWVGTAFTACKEALSSPGTRTALIAARGEQTMLTSAFDTAAGHAWPADVPERVLANRFTERWPTADDVTAADGAADRFLRAAMQTDAPDAICVNAGMGVGALDSVRPAADVVASLTP